MPMNKVCFSVQIRIHCTAPPRRPRETMDRSTCFRRVGAGQSPFQPIDHAGMRLMDTLRNIILLTCVISVTQWMAGQSKGPADDVQARKARALCMQIGDIKILPIAVSGLPPPEMQ